jgi:hypothetical protein
MSDNNEKYYALVGDEIVVCRDVIEWGMLFDREKRGIAFNRVGDVEISTVFLGLDHSFTGGEPVLFETMVFGGEHEGFCERYTTKEKAVEGHNRVLKTLFGRTVITEKFKEEY